MTLYLDPRHIVWSEFGGLEPSKPEWCEQFNYWRDYNVKFFASNGMDFDPEDHNVENWLMADDRAPFADMLDSLLPRFQKLTAITEVDIILLAHWLPDLHLGTSVTNFMMHRLGLEDCFGFAVSDRGLSAPFFAFDCLAKYLHNKERGILAIADQKHLMYKSEVIDRLKPSNVACLVGVDTKNTNGMRYAGYARETNVTDDGLESAISNLVHKLGLDSHRLKLIGPDGLIAQSPAAVDLVATRPELVCTAPFAALSENAETHLDHLLLCKDDDCLTALGFHGARL